MAGTHFGMPSIIYWSMCDLKWHLILKAFVRNVFRKLFLYSNLVISLSFLEICIYGIDFKTYN